MGMTIDKCANMLKAKEKCIERETSGTDIDCNLHNCDDCFLCYEQGTVGEQKEALKFAIETMRKYQKIEQIINYPVYIQEDVLRYKMICEVVGKKNITHGTYEGENRGGN